MHDVHAIAVNGDREPAQAMPRILGAQFTLPVEPLPAVHQLAQSRGRASQGELEHDLLVVGGSHARDLANLGTHGRIGLRSGDGDTGHGIDRDS